MYVCECVWVGGWLRVRGGNRLETKERPLLFVLYHRKTLTFVPCGDTSNSRKTIQPTGRKMPEAKNSSFVITCFQFGEEKKNCCFGFNY